MYEYKRYNIPFSIPMIDIDDFKVINDNYGHRVGDTVLMRVGELLKNFLRQIDIPTRYGGDEVLVLLPNTTLIFAQKAALKIQNLFKNIRFRTQGKEFMITISFGVYEVQPQYDAESMLKKSDIALYKAKQDGKDRVIIYSESEGSPVEN